MISPDSSRLTKFGEISPIRNQAVTAKNPKRKLPEIFSRQTTHTLDVPIATTPETKPTTAVDSKKMNKKRFSLKVSNLDKKNKISISMTPNQNQNQTLNNSFEKEKESKYIKINNMNTSQDDISSSQSADNNISKYTNILNQNFERHILNIDSAPESARQLTNGHGSHGGHGGLQIFEKVNVLKILSNRMGTPERREQVFNKDKGESPEKIENRKDR
jgi:hypothetical protein